MVAIVNFGNTKNVPCAVFGNGTLEITNITGTGILDGVEIPTKSIVIKTIPKGSEVGHYADSNSFEPQMVMSFLNEDAFCVLKDVIERIYEEYQSEKLKIK